MKYGLKTDIIDNLNLIFANFEDINRVILFGSRAKGNYKLGSDIDLALIGENLNQKSVFRLQDKIEELNLIYKIDLVLVNQIDNKELLEHINRVGIVIYNKVINE